MTNLSSLLKSNVSVSKEAQLQLFEKQWELACAKCNHDLIFPFRLVILVCPLQGNEASAGKAGLCFLSRVPSDGGAGGQLVPAQTPAR